MHSHFAVYAHRVDLIEIIKLDFDQPLLSLFAKVRDRYEVAAAAGKSRFIHGFELSKLLDQRLELSQIGQATPCERAATIHSIEPPC